MEKDNFANQATASGPNPEYDRGPETQPGSISAMVRSSPEELQRREKLTIAQVYGHVDAFVSMPSAQNFDNLALSLREMQTAWMNSRKRVMD